MMQEKQDQTSSPNSRRKKPSLRLSFFSNNHHGSGSIDVRSSPSSPSGTLPSPIRSPTAWIRSKAPDFPEIKDKYKKFTSRMVRHRRHSAGHSADFSYDPQSYSLNFQEHDDPSDGENSYRSFTSRLPLSPPKNTPINSSPTKSAAGMNLLRKSQTTLSEIPLSNGEAVSADQVQNMSLDESFQKTSLNGLDLPTLGQIPEVKEIESG